MVSDGVYRLKNAKSGTYFDNSEKDRNVIHGWDSRPGSGNQEWEISRRGEGYTLKNRASGRYAHASSGRNGTDVRASNEPSEWNIRDVGDGLYTIFLQGSDAVIDLDMGKDDNGTGINVWDSTGARQQKWHLERVGGGGESSHSGGHSGGTRAPAGDHAPPRARYNGPIPEGRYAVENFKTRTLIDLAGGSNQDGASVIGYTAGGTDNQKWDFQLGERGYRIRNAQSGTYLGYDSANEGTLTTGRSSPQEWEVLQAGEQIVLQAVGSNLILDLAEQTGKICLWSPHGGDNQKWNIHRV